MPVPFQYEQNMVEPAIGWLREQGLMVKKEFPTPWGICDLVGCSLNKSQVKKRLGLRQTKPICSQLRVHLLSLIPDQEQRTVITTDELQEHFGRYLDRTGIEAEVGRLIRDRFVEEASPGHFFKHNGWMPLHRRLVAMELKLTRVDDALHQAINNLGFADESYVGLPVEAAKRLLDSKRKVDFESRGVGVLAVNPTGCRAVLRPAKCRSGTESTATQVYSVERFWLPFLRDSKA
jgi:hypothetical protein